MFIDIHDEKGNRIVLNSDHIVKIIADKDAKQSVSVVTLSNGKSIRTSGDYPLNGLKKSLNDLIAIEIDRHESLIRVLSSITTELGQIDNTLMGIKKTI